MKTNTKISGQKIFSYEGLDIYISEDKAKTNKGKDRVWFQIRQNGENKEWRQTTCLVYSRAMDIQFTRKNKKDE